MNHSHNMDDIDKRILEILQERAKITNAKLSEEIGLSPAPTLERVKKLEQSGIISSYHAKVDIEKIGLGVTTFALATLNGHNRTNIEGFVEAIQKVPEVVECHHITGAGDFILKVVAKDIPSYQKLMLERLCDIPQVDHMQSMVILSTFKDSKVVSIP